LADLSLNWVIRLASPNPVMQLKHPGQLGVLGHLGLHEQRAPVRVKAQREQLGDAAQGALAQRGRVVVDGDGVQVGDEVERVVVVLQRDPLP